MILESGPASGERNYWLLVTVVLTAFGGWFFYDWRVGYNKKNDQEAEKHLAAILQVKPEEAEPLLRKLGESPTAEDFERLVQSNPTRIEDVRTALGEPLHRRRVDASDSFEYYASRYGVATVRLRNDRVQLTKNDWRKWHKDKGEVEAQFYWGLIPIVLALYPFSKLVRAVALRVRMNDSGMVYAGQRIEYDAITSVRDYSPKGWVDVYYRAESGGERKLRLDNQKVKKFEEIVELICRKKAFENPIAEYRRRKAAESEAESSDA